MNKSVLSLLVATFIMSGCAPKVTDTYTKDGIDIIDENLKRSIERIESVQNDFYRRDVRRNEWPEPFGGIIIEFDTQMIDVDFYGDAKTLIEQLASQRQFRFEVRGTRLDIPITIKARDQYNRVLEDIRAQIGYRANLVVNNSTRTITLDFTKHVQNPADDGRLSSVTTNNVTRPLSVTAGEKVQPQNSVNIVTSAVDDKTIKSTVTDSKVDATKKYPDVVKKEGKNKTLDQMISELVPVDYFVTISPEVNRKMKVSWTAGDWWTYTLKKVVESEKLTIIIDEKNQRIDIKQ